LRTPCFTAHTGMKISGHMIAASAGSGITLNELALKSAAIAKALNPTNRIVPSLMGLPALRWE
jgi:hypothetical protein